MIIKACERGGASKLAVHLLNTKDNEHVEIHEVSGFLSQNLKGALKEAYAVSRGTKCKKFLFSVILSPPAKENVAVADYEEAAQRVEKTMGLMGQPRVIVFHEKEGRRHAHAVWSRIDTQKMKAINLSYYKNKLNEIAKSLYLEHEWQLPKGFIDRTQRNPLNFTRQEWQKAKRLNDDPKAVKAALQECWITSDNKQSFIKALDQKGYYLAQGNRRAFVAVDWRGEVYSLSRSLGKKAKEIKDRLGDSAELASVEVTQQTIDQKRSVQVRHMIENVRQTYTRRSLQLMAERNLLKKNYSQAREHLKQVQEQRQVQEANIRQAKLRSGLRGLWDRITGKSKHVQQQNEHEAYEALRRDQKERDDLIFQQMQERQQLQRRIVELREQEAKELAELKESVFSKLPVRSKESYQDAFDRVTPQSDRGLDLDI